MAHLLRLHGTDMLKKCNWTASGQSHGGASTRRPSSWRHTERTKQPETWSNRYELW